MNPVVLIFAALGSGLVVGAVLGFRLGKRAGELDVGARLEDDQPYRQRVLERLAKIEGAKLELTE